ncbi:MAG: hypothetical protein LBJ14_10465 [Desulfarculales bacterium]|jgi:hypothetical protein|nr:hypothetical protein [Desulfarculales bacterium]
MISTVINIFSTVFSTIKANWPPYLIIAVMGLVILGAIWRIDHLSGALALEESRHEAAKDSLAREVEKGMGWKASYEKVVMAAEAHKEATEACLVREMEAQKAREERTAILQATQPRPRTKQEQQQVVNDEIRARAADRLNRTW